MNNRRSANEGLLVDTPGHLIDLMATCVDLGGANYPSTFNGNQITPLEGVSLAPAFSDTVIERPNPIFWEHEGNKAIRVGDWKLVSKHNGKPELFDLAKDRTEQNDLSGEMPNKVAELAGKWMRWADRASVQEWPVKKRKK